MFVSFGEGSTEYGPGIQIDLTGEEVAKAIEAYLVAHGIYQSGPRTIRVNGKLIEKGSMYVDPSGFVMVDGRRFNGNGTIDK